jgi:hypothetical protein
MYDLAIKAFSKLGDWAFNLHSQSKDEINEAAFTLRAAVTETQIVLGKISRSNEKQGSILGLWLEITEAGFPPTR